MEPENSVVLESCGEDSMLIQTVKTIVTQSNQNDLENEGFFLVTNVQDDQQRHMEVVNQEPCAENQTEERVLWSDLCRVCANVNDHLIPIFEGEGIEHELCNKIHKYLPIHVSESDTLPLQLCYHCAATLLAWHELTEGCLSAERRLLEIQESLHTKQQYAPPPTSEERLQEPPQSIPAVVNSVETIPVVVEPVELKDDGSGTSPINNSDRFGEQRKKSFAAYCSSHSATLCTQNITQTNLKNSNFKTMELDNNAQSKEDREEINPETSSCGSENIGIPNSANVNAIHSSKITLDRPTSELHNSPTETATSTKRNVKKFYTCTTCHRIYKREYNLLRHATKCKKLASKEKDPLDTSDIDAPILFDNPNDAMRTEKISTDKTESVCSDAAGDEEIDTWEEFNRPRRKSHASYPCVYCEYTTERKKLLKLHVVESHPEYAERKRKKLRCIDKEAVSHARMEVDGKVYYHCNECGKNLYSPYTFSWHIRIHTGERPFTCHLCGKQFRVNQGLARHLRETHAGIKNFPCDLCGRMFSTKRNAEDHRRIHTGERPYVCNVCGKTFKQKASLFVHNRTHSDVFPFKCSYCDQSFRTRPPLMVHITKHTGEKPHACDICGRCFRIKYELKRHRLIHFDEKPWQCTRWQIEANSVVPTIAIQDSKAEEVQYVECVQCDTVFIDVKCFIHHMNVEHGTQTYYCSYCKAAYRGSAEVFEEHMLSHEAGHETVEIADIEADAMIKQECENELDSGDVSKQGDADVLSLQKSYTCYICEESFVKKHDLKKHINAHKTTKVIQSQDEAELVNKAKQVINERISYSCDICKKLMFTKRGFLRHLRVHTGERPCKCDVCGKCYRIEQDLARHIRDVHEGLKKYACDICGRAFANKGAKDDHRRIHTGERPYTCEHCPKTFRTLNSIYIHNRVHTNYKPHKCSYCGKYFRSRQRLSNHETTHTGVKAYACEICGKSFSVKGEVMRHRAIHSQEKPFNCRCCDLKFGQKRYLRNHIKQHHKEEASLLLAELNEKRN